MLKTEKVDNFIESIVEMGRTYKGLLNKLQKELKFRLKVNDLNAIHAIILYKIGEDEFSVGDLNVLFESNINYPVNKLKREGYVNEREVEHDLRLTLVKLSDKGLDLFHALQNLKISNEENNNL